MREFCIFMVPVYHECVLFTAASIMGPPEQFVHQGSTVTLTCVVPAPYSHGKRPPRVVDWFHSDRLVSIQVQIRHLQKVSLTYFLHRSSKCGHVYLFETKYFIYARQVCIAAFYIQGDQKVSVHLMITIQKVTSNVQSVRRQSPDVYWHPELCSRRTCSVYFILFKSTQVLFLKHIHI
jgi:hypothetical protein